jgi:hypothetical protein
MKAIRPPYIKAQPKVDGNREITAAQIKERQKAVSREATPGRLGGLTEEGVRLGKQRKAASGCGNSIDYGFTRFVDA